MNCRPVYVVTTTTPGLVGPIKTLFGIHKAPRLHAPTQTFVLTFEHYDHAERVAKGLDGYKDLHGSFPHRDADITLTTTNDTVQDRPDTRPRRSVKVEELPLSSVLEDTRGTGIAISHVNSDGSSTTLRTSTDHEDVVRALELSKNRDDDPADDPADDPFSFYNTRVVRVFMFLLRVILAFLGIKI
jgi:hypothetical protein